MNRLFEALSDAEMDQPSPKAVQRAVSPPTVIRLDVRAIGIARLKSSQELESEQVSPEDIPQNVSPFDLTPILAALEAETEQVSLKAIPRDVTPSEVAPMLAALEAETEQVSPEAIPRDVTPSEVAPILVAMQADTEQILPAAIRQDVSPFEVIPILAALEAETEQVSLQAIPQHVTPSEVAPILAGLEVETEQVSPAAIPRDVTPSEVAPILAALEAETEQVLPAAICQDVTPFEVAPILPAFGAETEQLSRGAVSPDVTPSEVAPPVSAQEAETEQLSPEAVSLDVTPSEVAPPMSAQEAETEQLSPEAVSLDVTPSEVTPPMSAQEAETEQLSPEAVSPGVTPSEVARPDRPDVRTAPSLPTREAAGAKDCQLKSAESPAPRSVHVKVRPESRLVALTDPNSLGAEKFRALVTRLEHPHKHGQLKRFQVTSSVNNEGKTLVSGNIAVTLAKYFGSKTLLIEGDLHRPTLATIFGLNNMRGLSHWWSGRDQELAKFVHRLDDLPLWFLSAGKPCDRPSDILRSDRFEKAFVQLASQFEWIVVDSTPMLPIVDVNLWSRLVDGTLLVVREGVTPVKALKQGLRALDHPNLIGVVLNEASATDEAKYNGQYYGSPNRY
jgi:capsular exopolysaccharide synthesis family protein